MLYSWKFWRSERVVLLDHEPDEVGGAQARPPAAWEQEDCRCAVLAHRWPIRAVAKFDHVRLVAGAVAEDVGAQAVPGRQVVPHQAGKVVSGQTLVQGILLNKLRHRHLLQVGQRHLLVEPWDKKEL